MVRMVGVRMGFCSGGTGRHAVKAASCGSVPHAHAKLPPSSVQLRRCMHSHSQLTFMPALMAAWAAARRAMGTRRGEQDT